MYYEVFILLKKRLKTYKVKAKTESGKLLAVLKFKNCLVYISTRNTMIKMLFFKLYKFKNPLFLREVSKPIGIQSLNDALVIQDSTKENISLDLLKIDDDDINFLKFIKFPALRFSKLPKLLALEPLKPIITGPFKLLEPENRPVEEFMKFIDSLNLDKM